MSKISQYGSLATPADNDELLLTDPNDTTMSATGTTKTITTANLLNDAAPARMYDVLAASGLRSLLADIAFRNSTRIDIPVLGDSITEGQGVSAFTSRWIANCNRAFRIAYPTTANGSSGGLGFIPIASTGESSYTWPVTLASGTPATADLGPVRACAAATAAASWTWTAPAGTTSVKVMYYDSITAGSFAYKVGSGGTTTVSNAGSATDLLTASITITSGQVLTIAWASGTVYIDGIMHYAGDETSGVTWHGCGHFGWNTGTGASGWNQAETSGRNWAQCYASAFPNVGALAFMLGVNDARTGSGGIGVTASAFQSSLSSLVSTIQGASGTLAGLPLIFIAPYQVNDTFADAGGWPAYVTAIRAISAGIAKSHVIDLNYRMPSVASVPSYYADNLHPASLGAAYLGEIAGAAVRIA